MAALLEWLLSTRYYCRPFLYIFSLFPDQLTSSCSSIDTFLCLLSYLLDKLPLPFTSAQAGSCLIHKATPSGRTLSLHSTFKPILLVKTLHFTSLATYLCTHIFEHHSNTIMSTIIDSNSEICFMKHAGGVCEALKAHRAEVAHLLGPDGTYLQGKQSHRTPTTCTPLSTG